MAQNVCDTTICKLFFDHAQKMLGPVKGQGIRFLPFRFHEIILCFLLV